ncbi:MAG: preprotein translocase subunit SecE [Lactovum sp.]
MFRFIKSIGHEMKMTTWPDRKQSWHDFVMVIEYTIFFMLFIMFFDWGIKAIMKLVADIVLPFLQ